MGRPMLKVHLTIPNFRDHKAYHWQEAMARTIACNKYNVVGQNGTLDPREVTCGKCKVTKTYKYLVSKISSLGR